MACPDPGLLTAPPFGGDMGERVRSFDWSRTPLGPMESWSPSLRMMVRFLLANRFPMLLWWGPRFIQIYNDPYRPILGVKHPELGLGRPVSECWSEIWHILRPLVETPFRGGPSTWMDDLMLELHRFGFVEETHFTIAYSPVPDETAENGIGGVLATVNEITEKVVGERRVAALRDLAAQATAAKTPDEACAIAAAALEAHPRDVPFALIYLVDPDGKQARRAAMAGAGADAPIAPLVVPLEPGCDGGAAWPFAEVTRTGALAVVERLGERFAALPPGPWSSPPHTAVVVPLPGGKESPLAGLLVAGVSARLRLDEAYLGFLELVAAQIASGIRNASAYEHEKRRAEDLAELDRAKTAFFSNVSHEFRTPLTLMLGPLEELLADPRAPATAVAVSVRVAHRNGLRLLKLVNALLDFARIEAGRIEASYEPVDLASLTTEIAATFRSLVEKAGLRLAVDCPPLPEPVYVDREMWEKVVLNLLSNAFKFTFDGEIAIELAWRGDRVELAVRDTGVGIPEAELPRIFQRFHRVRGARSRSHEGTGIGLALVQELARLHGGEVSVTSREGRGTTFVVRLRTGKAHLPADRVEAARSLASTGVGPRSFLEEAARWIPDAHDASEVLPHLASPVGPRPRVLVADDNADMREYLTRLLATRYDVEAVADGEAALAAARARLPDLVLSDVMMPRMDGAALVRALRAEPTTRSTPVILLSARAGEESRVEGLDLGADDYLVKPFGANELLARVGTHVKLARLRQSSEDELRASRELIESDLRAATLLYQVGDACVAPDASLDGCLQRVVDAAIAITGAAKGLLFLRETAPGGARFAAQAGFEPGLLERLAPESAPADVAGGLAMARGERVVVEDVEQSPIHAGAPTLAVMRAAGVRAVQSTPLVSSSGALLGILSTHFPVPHRPSDRQLRFLDLLARQAADYLERKQVERALREADRRKDDFLATLAHELRNPLAPIRYAMQLLDLKRREDAEVAASGAVIERQVGHMARLLDDLLDVSRITRNKLELRTGRVRLDAVLENAIETSRPLIEAGAHALDVVLPEEPLEVDADPVRLAQVFANLLNNSAKYTERGGRIVVRGGLDGDDVVVSVRDSGIGIGRELLPRVFDMFAQEQAVLERSQGGLGIGLALVKALVELHGGTVQARSDGLDKGSEFVVRLPRPKSAAGAAPAPRSEPTAEAPVRARVLVADDNEDAAAMLAVLLRTLGHEVRTARDGVQALDLVATFRPHVALLDIGMPGRNGYDVAAAIRAEPQHRSLRLIAITGWGQQEDRRRALAAGFDAHLVKPVDFDPLQRLLAELEIGSSPVAPDPAAASDRKSSRSASA